MSLEFLGWHAWISSKEANSKTTQGQGYTHMNEPYEAISQAIEEWLKNKGGMKNMQMEADLHLEVLMNTGMPGSRDDRPKALNVGQHFFLEAMKEKVTNLSFGFTGQPTKEARWWLVPHSFKNAAYDFYLYHPGLKKGQEEVALEYVVLKKDNTALVPHLAEPVIQTQDLEQALLGYYFYLNKGE